MDELLNEKSFRRQVFLWCHLTKKQLVLFFLPVHKIFVEEDEDLIKWIF